MKIISWNVNGLRAVLKNQFEDNIKTLDPDFICIQETKLKEELENTYLSNYYKYFNFSRRLGYSGVAIFSKKKADNIIVGMKLENECGELENFDVESRVLTLEYNDFYIVSVYVPYSQTRRNREDFRIEFDEKFQKYIEKLNDTKNVIVCGDFNVCHKDIDIYNLEKHENLKIFADEKRANFNELLKELNLIDTYRFMHPQMRKFTYWTNEINNRNRSGWRLDYILVSEFLRKNIRQANILDGITGSDHCPIELIIKM